MLWPLAPNMTTTTQRKPLPPTFHAPHALGGGIAWWSVTDMPITTQPKPLPPTSHALHALGRDIAWWSVTFSETHVVPTPMRRPLRPAFQATLQAASSSDVCCSVSVGGKRGCPHRGHCAAQMLEASIIPFLDLIYLCIVCAAWVYTQWPQC